MAFKGNFCVFYNREEKIAIMREKHTALMKPIVFALEHVRSITAAPAETPHEKWFQDNYGDAIENALEKLKNPLNPAKPGSSWLPFKEVLHARGRVQCRNNCCTMCLTLSFSYCSLTISALQPETLSSQQSARANWARKHHNFCL